MWLLSDASSIVFLKFLQVFLWISIPALLIGMLITTVSHYRNKRKKVKTPGQPYILEESVDYDDVSLMSLNLQVNNQEAKKIVNYLSFSNARYIAIQKDFKTLSEKYQQLQANIYKNSETKKIEFMETIQTDLQPITSEQIARIKQQHESEKKRIAHRISSTDNII